MHVWYRNGFFEALMILLRSYFFL